LVFIKNEGWQTIHIKIDAFFSLTKFIVVKRFSINEPYISGWTKKFIALNPQNKE